MQRNNTVTLLAIVLGVLALGATAWMLLGRSATPPPPPPVAALATPTPAARWVAARDIPPRTILTSEMLRQDFKSGAIPTGAITSLDDVEGQLTNEPILAGDTVLSDSFTPRLRRKVKADIPIPAGLRGVAIWVDPDQTAAGLVDVGDRVDVISTHKLTYDKGPRQYVIGALTYTAARTVAQNLLVLAVDESIKAPEPTPTPIPGAPPAAPPAAAAPTPIPPPDTNAKRTRILLAATPEVAARLVSANDQGVLNVTIRNPIDGDAGLVPEAREYPSRVVTAPREPTSGSGGSGGGNSNSGGAVRRNPLPLPVFNSPRQTALSPMVPRPDNVVLPPPAPFPTPRPGGMEMRPMTPPEPTTREITVVRGTEKTIVIVPKR